MKFIFLTITLSLMFPANTVAHELPDLGDVSQATITPREERLLGLQIMRQIRADTSYLDDPEISNYLNSLGHKLIASSTETSPGQSFEFFALQDSTINAFALPGGFMGFNSGLIIAAQSESELAGVMAHEIAHVTQKHLARMISGHKYNMIASIAALAVAILASRSNPQAGQAVIAATQAGAIQSQLNFTRKHEKEADRVGLNILLDAGFDPQGMSTFFERLQKASRFYENGAPSYLRTHPLTFERIADIQNRTHEMPYRQVADSTDFLLVRAKLRALQGKPSDAVNQFRARLEEKRYINEAVERYGYTLALLRDKKNREADEELARLYTLIQSDNKTELLLKDHRLGKTILVQQKGLQAGAMIETLAAAVKLANGQTDDALKIYRTALRIYPQHKALIHGYANALLLNHQIDTALELINRELQFHPKDIQLYRLQARAYALQDKLMLKHRAQAEVYILQGYYDPAIEQLQIALKHDNGDFYQLSTVEARLRQLQKIMAEEKEN
ncbi:MAG: M48 family metallopeptidase [Burkholderiales bacterium]|nr:M48 family metallopeptidase [Nitrosomonas sp.]MCP5275441.1 M48 family metallopeptidase [Burkholderiales bacterium]